MVFTLAEVSRFRFSFGEKTVVSVLYDSVFWLALKPAVMPNDDASTYDGMPARRKLCEWAGDGALLRETGIDGTDSWCAH